MKHKFMSQDTCLTIFNVWLAALILSPSLLSIVISGGMTVMWGGILIMAAKRDYEDQHL